MIIDDDARSFIIPVTRRIESQAVARTGAYILREPRKPLATLGTFNLLRLTSQISRYLHSLRLTYEVHTRLCIPRDEYSFKSLLPLPLI